MPKKRELTADIGKLYAKIKEVADYWQLDTNYTDGAIKLLITAQVDKIVDTYIERKQADDTKLHKHANRVKGGTEEA